MSVRTPPFDAELLAYLRRHSRAEHPLLAQIRRETAGHRMGKMAIAPEQAEMLVWLARLIGARRYLEIGVFTGYSSTAVALALPDDAQLDCCDINVSFTEHARRYWQAAGIEHKIRLNLQPALITLEQLLAAGAGESYDLAFIDADKEPTPQYYERCLQLVRRGGIIAIDNILLGGRVARPLQSDSPPAVAVLQQFNADLALDERVLPITLPLGDGLTLLQKL